MRFLLFIVGILAVAPAFAEDLSLGSAISKTRASCSGIAGELNHIKTMAGINTAITGVGTAAAGGALAAGIAKQKADRLAEEIAKQLDSIDDMSDAEFLALLGKLAEYKENKEQALKDAQAEAEQKSKKLGNARTGLMAGNTAANIAGTAIAATNRADGDLMKKFSECVDAANALGAAIGQGRLDGAEESQLAQAKKIQDTCAKLNLADLEKLNKRATGAMVSSGIGIATGASGTITSAVANTDKTRADDSDSGKQKEKNLNIASNVLAGVSAGASLAATVFNATQIAMAKKLIAAAEECEEAIK